MSVNHRLVNPLTDQLFDGILTLKTKEECYEFLKIFVRSMNCVTCRSVWKWHVCSKREISMTASKKRRVRALPRFPREALLEIRCRRICAGALPDGKDVSKTTD